MMHIKLFENFNPKLEETLEDIKWILLEIDEYTHLLRSELDGNLLIYSIELDTNTELTTVRNRLEDLGYNLIDTTNPWQTEGKFIIYNMDYFNDHSKNGIALKWLTDKFSDLKKSSDMIKTYYKNENGNKIFEFFHIESNPDCFINNYLLYTFLELEICLSNNDIKSIVKKWLKESYNLNNFDDILEQDF